MQNNQSSLQQYLSFDFNTEYQTKGYRNEEVDLFNDADDDDDCFDQSYAELNSQTQSFENSSFNASRFNTNQNSINQNLKEDSPDGDSFLNTTINYADYDAQDYVDYNAREDYSQVEADNEIHYLNFIRKSEIAVSQQKLQENQNKSEPLDNYQQEENKNLSQDYNNNQQEENLKTYSIVCIDDSKAVVNAIKMYLDDNLFSVVGINDPLKALMQVIRLKPDLILLDITMPTLDGYELCSLLRKHSALKETPIIMVTGKKGIINRVKAKMVKASDYITKPFEKKDLLKVIFKYIV